MVESNKFSGSILIEKEGKILLSEGYGKADFENDVKNTSKTKYNIGSITKTFTATSIMQLAESGKLDLNDTVDKYIEDYPMGNKISISDLLSQKSGIPDYENFPDFLDTTMRMYRSPQEIINSFKNEPLEFEPGSKYKYSNSAYTLLAYIIEKTSGITYEDYLEKNIFSVLEMNDTQVGSNKKIIENRARGYSITNNGIENCDFMDNSNEFGAGGIYSTVEDLYKWHKAINSEKILKRESWEKMLRPYSESYGYGWLIGEFELDGITKKVVGHNGLTLGFSSLFFNYIEDDMVIIVLCNYDDLSHGMNTASNIGIDITRIIDGTYDI